MERLTFQDRTENDFYDVLCKRVKHYFESTGQTRYGNGLMFLKVLVYGGLSLAIYLLILSNRFTPLELLGLSVLLGLALLGYVFNVGHEAAHGGTTRYKWLNQFLFLSNFHIMGISGYLWQLRHVNSHHIFPNVNGYDTDIDSNDILRFSPNSSYRWWFKFQPLYAPLLYMIVQIHLVFYKDFKHWRRKRLANLPDIKHPTSEAVMLVLGKLLHVALFLVIPYMVLHLAFWQIFLGYFVMSGVCSFLFVIFFAGTHFADECIFPPTPENGVMPTTWAEHMVRASVDWNVDSRLWHFLVGGANAHTAHHLFPQVCHVHYYDITKIIQQTAAEFGIPYNSMTLWELVRSHFRLLLLLSRPLDEEALRNSPLINIRPFQAAT